MSRCLDLADQLHELHPDLLRTMQRMTLDTIEQLEAQPFRTALEDLDLKHAYQLSDAIALIEG